MELFHYQNTSYCCMLVLVWKVNNFQLTSTFCKILTSHAVEYYGTAKIGELAVVSIENALAVINSLVTICIIGS